MKLVTAAMMKEIDRRSIEERGIPASALMETAGRIVAIDIAERFPRGSAVVLCGKGNNGGDGFVAARYLHLAGWQANVVYTDEPTPDGGPARAAWDQLQPTIARYRHDAVEDMKDFISSHDVAVDALLGIGFKGQPKAPYDALIEAMNTARIPIFAVDIPSGVNPDTGAADLAVRAFRTITFGLAKVGMVTGDGPTHCGSIRVESINFPADLLAQASSVYTSLTMQEAAALLPTRPRDGHKGTFGLLVIAAGSALMPGAAVLAATGGLRGGCGLVRVHAPQRVLPVLAAHLPEILLSESRASDSVLAPLPPDALQDLFAKATALAVGPGMTTKASAAGFLAQMLASPLPTVVDADSLNLLAENEGLRRMLGPRHVLTPHPGEMARLLRIDTTQVQADRWGSAARAARDLGCTVVLKGFGTLVAEPDGSVCHCSTGNTAWARGGAGDVLTGLIGSLLAQGLKPADAARLGVFVHGLAADHYVADRSPRGATTREVAECLPAAFRELEETQRRS